MINRLTPVFLFLLLLSGCAGLAPTLPPSVQLDPDSAYISGLFNRTKGANFAFVIRSTDGKTEYVMPMGEDKALPSQITNSSIAIKVLPGTYSISQWITYATLSKDVITRKPIENTFLSRPFIVKAGSVTHLGSFTVGSNTSNGGFNGYAHLIQFEARIQPIHATRREVQDAFIQAYPNLGVQPFVCLFCSDTSISGQSE